MLRFKIDENLPNELLFLFLQYGMDAMNVEQQGLAGKSDSVVFPVCQAEDRTFITFDVEFGNIRIYPPESHAGVIVLRLKSQDKLSVLDVCQKMMHRLEELESMQGQLWIVDEQNIRIRT
jgi:predicted nuclease of predicted toxin-antitoxin system